MPEDPAHPVPRGALGGPISFGPFLLLPGAPAALLRDDRPVDIGARAISILVELAAAAGTVVSKDALLARVWPDRAVDETNLRAQIRALRAALNDDGEAERYIVNVPGRGYALVAPVRHGLTPDAPHPGTPRLPASLSRVIGRDALIRDLSTLVVERRLLTILGPGGIGKTTVAVAVARNVTEAFGGAITFIDLAAATDAAQVPDVVANALNIALPERDRTPQLVRALEQEQTLLVFDNCEHVLDGVATLAEALMRSASSVHLLATSREALAVNGEWVHRLAPLDVPPAEQRVTAAEAMTYSAIQLFVDRAHAASSAFALTDENAESIAEIARRLDGIPLTIEFGATHMPLLGAQGLASELQRQAALSLRGRRTAPSRHRTLEAMLDWSYRLLSPPQQRALRALAIFSGVFSQSAAAGALVAVGGRQEAAQMLADLVAKSVVVREADGYRLLEVTRSFAMVRLRASGDFTSVARRHATGVLDELRSIDVSADRSLPDHFKREAGNLRSALDWALSPGGDCELAVELAAAAMPHWIRLSLLGECIARLRQVLPLLAGTDDDTGRRRLLLLRSLAAAEVFSFGPSGEAQAIWNEILAIADRLDDPHWRDEGLRGVWMNSLHRGDIREALLIAERYGTVVPGDGLLGGRMIGYALHLMGDHDGARPLLQRMIDSFQPSLHGPAALRFLVDPEVTARMRLGFITWMQGHPDEAAREVQAAARTVLQSNHGLTICSALLQGAIPVSLLRGDLQAAEGYLHCLTEAAEHSGLSMFLEIARCVAGTVANRRGNPAEGISLISQALGGPSLAALGFLVLPFRTELAQALGAVGDIARGTDLVDRTIAKCEQGHELWFLPELLRTKAGLLATRDAAGAEMVLIQAMELARRQRARAWTLRCATDLAALLSRRGRIQEAANLLRPIQNSFTEGFTTDDHIAAARLLRCLAAATRTGQSRMDCPRAPGRDAWSGYPAGA